YYHASEDTTVKTVDQLWDIYMGSVGRNANLLLNLPVDRRGLVHETDSARLIGLKARLDAVFAENLALGQPAEADQLRGPGFEAAMATDGDSDTYWAAPDSVTQAALSVRLPEVKPLRYFVLREQIALGQRIDSFSIEVWQDDTWHYLTGGTTIGDQRILETPGVETDRFRVRIHSALATPTLSEVAVY
ncbi:MAG: glycoside hydrolase family 29, partial [Bacteroidetes bacterium]